MYRNVQFFCCIVTNMYTRGLPISKLYRIQTDTDRYLQKYNHLHLAKFSKKFHFLSICIQNLQKVLTENFVSFQFSGGVARQGGFFADSNFFEMSSK
jgi:hypothetical protein